MCGGGRRARRLRSTLLHQHKLRIVFLPFAVYSEGGLAVRKWTYFYCTTVFFIDIWKTGLLIYISKRPFCLRWKIENDPFCLGVLLCSSGGKCWGRQAGPWTILYCMLWDDYILSVTDSRHIGAQSKSGAKLPWRFCFQWRALTCIALCVFYRLPWWCQAYLTETSRIMTDERGRHFWE